MARTPWLLAVLFVALAGCADFGFAQASYERRFSFEEDTFAFPNELVWSYHVDELGRWHVDGRSHSSTYIHRCFVLARTARQFFQHARFDPAQPPPDDATLRELVRRVTARSPREQRPDAERILVPGYPSLRALSEARPELLREEIGSALWSYVERGGWRMVIPFTRHHQARTARRVVEALDRRRPVILHLVRFPHITINHAVLVYDYMDDGDLIRFLAYDPNAPAGPAILSYDRRTRTFQLGRNAYFRGGRVDAYEIYHRPWF